MNNQKQLIYLSALIHDIGKFYQRADEDGTRNSKVLSERVKRLENVLCPTWQGKTTHKHVLWTAQFVENISSHLNKYLNPNQELKPDILLKTAAAHHKPSSYIEKIIQKADHYSSGADRSKDEAAWKDAVEEEDKKWDSFKRIAMRSIFETVSLSGEKDKDYQYEYKLPVKKISLNKEECFPTKSELPPPDYKTLWNNFLNEMKFIQSKSFQTFSETLLFLLEKYTSRIPSSTIHLPDVSLYDHSKTTAAFAVCLYDYIVKNEYDKKEKIPDSDEQPFLLIGGDLSGIQKFIYDIAARGAAKNLKGRSFYLQLLIDNIVRYMLDKLELFDASIIYASGGGFYLLAPNTENIKEKIKGMEKIIPEKLFDHHGTLFLSIDHIPFGEQELFYKENQRSVSDIWMDLSEKLGRKKGRRIQSIIENNYDRLFSPQPVNPSKEKDYITGEEITDKSEFLDKANQKMPINHSTWEQIELGKKLKNTDYWLLAREKLTYFHDQSPINPIGIGYFNYFLEKKDVDKAENQLKQSADRVRVIFFNKGNFLESLQKGIDNVYGFTWYGGNDYPENKFKEPKTFTELAGIQFDKPNYKEEEQKRIAGPELVRMGVLRMDVDNLGAIFRRGITKSKRSFSRYCTLSRSLDYFFKGYLNALWKNNKEYRSYTQIIYAGGDDLFIVGKWDILERMAKNIYDMFREWTCHNPDFTLSGGMAIVGPKFPILKTAEYSEVYEKAAKKHIWNGIEKNTFSLFGYSSINKKGKVENVLFSFNWQHEYETVLALKKELKELFNEDKGLPSGFAGEIYHLMQQAHFQFNHENNQYLPNNYRVIWLAAYQFKRAMKDSKNEKVKLFLEKWVENIMTGKISATQFKTQYHSLQLLALAARWAALEKRSIV